MELKGSKRVRDILILDQVYKQINIKINRKSYYKIHFYALQVNILKTG